MTDLERRDYERKISAKYLVEKFSREERYLRIFSRDFANYLQSAKWLQSDEARKVQKFYDFLADFENLRAKMTEFRWTKDFLLANGIDFLAVRKLYFSVV